VAMLLVCLALAATALGRERRPRECDVGSTAGCDDGDPCTTDVCAGTHCMHTPATGPACDDHDGCTEHDRCEAGRCVGTPVACEDDGFSCTDDVCLAGRCMHVPVAGRCVPVDACTTAVCTPGRADADSAGCAPGRPLSDGHECGEDGDACTDDVCAAGHCSHPPVEDQATCGAVEGAFRHALALEGSAAALTVAVATEASGTLAAHLGDVERALAEIARTLAGKTSTARAGDGGTGTPVQRRARIALALLGDMRGDLTAIVRAARRAAPTARVGGTVGVMRRTRALVRGTRVLAAELRRLLGVKGSFVR